MAMIRISGTMIVRNEAARLAACLDALRGVADEMIIVDTGSEDGTLEIARRYTDLCFEHPWTDDFAAARNAALAHATGDYVLVVDADEVIAEPKAAAEALRRFATVQDPCCAGTVAIHNVFGQGDSRQVHVDHVERFFRRDRFLYAGAIHEQLTPHDGAKTSAETGVRLLHMGYAQAPGDPAHKAHRNIPLLQREIERFPGDEYYHFQLGKAYFSIEAWAEATEALEAALARIDFSQPSPRGRLAPVARNVLTDAVCTLAYARVNLGAFDEAVALVKRHQEMAHAGTKWADFEHAQGYVYLMRGDFAASRRAFEAALALGPSREDVLGAGSFSAAYHMGLLCEAEDDLIGALNWYLRAVHYNSGYAPALRRCVDLVAERGIVLPPEIYAACQSSVLDGFYTAKLDACLAKGEDGAVATLLKVAASLSPALAEACARQCAMHE